MNNIKINIDQFKLQYDFSKRNYNIIVHSPNGTGKYDFTRVFDSRILCI